MNNIVHLFGDMLGIGEYEDKLNRLMATCAVNCTQINDPSQSKDVIFAINMGS